MGCPTIKPIGTPDIEANCRCSNGKIGRWVTFAWQVDTSSAPNVTSFRTAASIHDGTQWLTASAVDGTPERTDYQSRVFLELGPYLWIPIVLTPDECQTEPPSDPVTGTPFIVDKCCDQTLGLVGEMRIFSVRDDQPDLDLTDQLNQGDCVTVDRIVALFADSGCPFTVEWLSPATPSAPSANTTQPISLPDDGSPVTVAAKVTLAGCPAKPVSKEVRQCVSGPEKKWWCLGGDWCAFYEAMAMYPLIGAFVSAALTGFVPIFIFTFAPSIAGFGIAGVMIWLGIGFFITCFCAAFFIDFVLLSLIFHILWWSCCRPSFCRYLEDLYWVLCWSAVLCNFIPISGWFFLPLQCFSFFVVMTLIIRNRCTLLLPLSLPHLR